MPKPRPNYKPFNEAQRDLKCPSFNGVPEFVVRPRTNVTSQPFNHALPKKLPNKPEDPALEQLIAMFQSVLDQDIVSVVWNDCHGNVDEALDILTSVAASAEPDKFQAVSYPELNVPNEIRSGPSLPVSNPWPQPPVSVPAKSNNKPSTLNPQAAAFRIPSVRENILDKLQNGTKVLVLMRGVPGSGKSTLAHQIKGATGTVLSTDDFFLTEDGQYNYKRELLGRAHDWNRERCLEAFRKALNPVVIDNTNLEAWEMKPYVDMALDFGYWVEILEPETPWRHKPRILAQKNNHGVPKDRIELMLEKLQVPVRARDLVKEAFAKKKALAMQKSVSEPLRPTGPPSSSVSYSNLTAQPSEPGLESWRTVPKPQRAKKWVNNSTSSSSASSSAFSGSNDGESSESKPMLSTWDDNFCEPKPQRTKKWGEVPESTSSWSTEAEMARQAAYSLLGSGSGEWCASGTPTGNAEKELQAESVDKSTQTQYSDYFDTQSDGTPAKIMLAKPRAISLSNGSTNTSPEPGIRQKWTLEKGCNTEEIQEEPSLNNLASLQAWFPNNTSEDLADVLDKCGGDLIWAVNLLLDSGYEMVETTPDFSAITAPELVISDELAVAAPAEALPEALNEEPQNSKDLAGDSEAVESGEERKAKARLEAKRLKEELESAFLVSGVSERARRICGRDYDEFRACTMRKAREAREMHVENQVAAIEAMYGSQTDDNLAGVIENQANHVLTVGQPGEMEEMLTFTMDHGMAEQLQYYCGTPPSLIDSNYQYWAPENLTLTIPKSLAQQLHMYWCASIPNPMVTPQDWDFAYDEEFAQYLTRMESEHFSTLQDVMDFEYAMQMAENDKLLGQVHKRDSMATKLSRQMLRENFPLVDPLALEAVFEAHLYNYEQTVSAVAASFNVAQAEPRQFQVSTAKPKPAEAEGTNEAEYLHRSARDLRAEALLYYQMKAEAMQKAQEQYRKGMKAAAAFYAEKGRRFTALYKEANRQAAQVILEESNASNDERTLDLHMLYVTEALAVLEVFLSQCNDSGTVLNIITGQGRHSVDGRAKIKPAVMEYLRSKNMSFEHVNAGMLQVRLNRRGR